MSEGATLYLLLWLLYLSECFLWVNKQSIAFVSPWGGQWRLAFGSSFLATTRGGALLLNPLLPTSRVLVSSLSPVSISPDGLCAFNAQSFANMGRPERAPLSLSFDKIETCARDERRVLINDAPFADCASLTEAQQLVEVVNQAKRTSSGARPALVRKFIAQRFAKSEAFAALEKLWPRLRALEMVCLVFFFLLFFAAPVMALRFGLEAIIIPAAVVMIAFAAAIAAQFFQLHKKLFPQFSSERIATAAKIVLCPPGAIRVLAHLTATATAPYDPLLLASLLPASEQARFAAAYLRDLHYPLKGELDGQGRAIVDWYRGEIETNAMAHLKKHTDLRLESLTAAPALDSDCRSYCPRCQSPFTIATGECTQCDGVQLTSTT